MLAVYIDLVMLLNFGIDLLLLIAADRLSGHCSSFVRLFMAAAVGALYAGACLIPGFSFLQNTFWRVISLGILSAIAFGLKITSIRRAILFVLLTLALGGAALGLGTQGIPSLLLCAVIILLLCIYGLGGKIGNKEYLQVELHYKEKRKVISALVDTGNTLIDPVTSQNVTVLGSNIAYELLGLSETQLRDPIGTIAASGISGLRLIPYHAVGVSSGLLLSISMDAVLINGREAGNVVAFAPSVFQNSEGYQGLVGGTYYV